MQRKRKEVFLVQVKDTGKGSSREEAQQQAAEKVNIVIIVFIIIVIMITNNPFLILGILSFTPLSLSSTQLKSTHQVLRNLQARCREPCRHCLHTYCHHCHNHDQFSHPCPCLQPTPPHQVLRNLQARARGRKTSTMISRLHTRRISLEVRKV